jgi:hypothetical protein
MSPFPLLARPALDLAGKLMRLHAPLLFGGLDKGGYQPGIVGQLDLGRLGGRPAVQSPLPFCITPSYSSFSRLAAASSLAWVRNSNGRRLTIQTKSLGGLELQALAHSGRHDKLFWATTENVSLQQGLIQVRAKTIEGERWQPKTAKNRGVPISQALRSYLETYTVRPTTGGWFFPSPEGKRWDADNFSADLRDSNRKHGLIWTCLDYRHSFGSHLAQKGTSLYKISEMMGNSPEICRRHYASLCPDVIRGEVDFSFSREPDFKLLTRGVQIEVSR